MSLRYDKIRVIGQGAFGKVFLCKKVGDSTHVVMKQIPVDDLPPDERKSAMNEVDVLAMLQHPNIIAYYDSFVEDKSLNIVMEYAPGGTLCEYIQERNGRLLEEEHILQLFVQTLVAIEHVHLMNILHRDLKPQNIMLNKKRTVVKIGDFGIAKVLSSKITSAQTVVGTPCYISPEICEGRMYNRKSDIWALGCILYELTALHKAFEGSNLPALVMKIMQGSRALSPLNDKYSQGLTLLINSMLCRNPEERPNIENIMANPVLVNTLINLGTTVGRLPCSKQNKSHFRDDYSDMSEKAQSLAPIKPVVYMWGGSLSLPLVLPQPIESHVTGIDLGRTHRIALTEDGKLINWELESGSLNTVGLTLASRAKAKEPIIFQPHLVEGLSNIDIKKVSCGDLFTACLTDNGILMTYGSGINGCLGHGNYDDVSKPKLVGSMLQYETSDMDCGANHMVAITSDNEVFSWGRNESGQLGTGDTATTNVPVRVTIPQDVIPSTVHCGPDTSLLITSTGTILVTGSNRYNKLGMECTMSTDVPAILQMTSSFKDLSQTSMLMSSVFTKSMQKPLGVEEPKSKATRIFTKSMTFRHTDSSILQQLIKTASIGINHCGFINSNGECITSGDNSYGQVGHDNDVPSIVDGLMPVEHISCGDSYTIISTRDGEVYSWGCGKRGRLGYEYEGNQDKPTLVAFEKPQTVQMIKSDHSVTMVMATPISL